MPPVGRLLLAELFDHLRAVVVTHLGQRSLAVARQAGPDPLCIDYPQGTFASRRILSVRRLDAPELQSVNLQRAAQVAGARQRQEEQGLLRA
jgi:hypothetical protein